MVIRFFFSEHRKKWDKHGSPSYRSQMTGLSLTWRTSNQNHGTIEDTANWEKKRNAFYVQNDNKIQYFCSSASPPRSSTLGRIQVAKDIITGAGEEKKTAAAQRTSASELGGGEAGGGDEQRDELAQREPHEHLPPQPPRRRRHCFASPSVPLSVVRSKCPTNANKPTTACAIIYFIL